MLQYPTMAERFVARARAQHCSLYKLSRTAAVRATIEREHIWPSIVQYTFDDDSSIRTRGHGRAYHIETLLP